MPDRHMTMTDYYILCVVLSGMVYTGLVVAGVIHAPFISDAIHFRSRQYPAIALALGVLIWHWVGF